jgi:hypothetical protein
MKRIIYALAIVISCATFFTACTEEPVTPTNTESDNSGGEGTGDKLPGTP